MKAEARKSYFRRHINQIIRELKMRETWAAVTAEAIAQAFLCYMVYMVIYSTKLYAGTTGGPLATSLVIALGHAVIKYL